MLHLYRHLSYISTAPVSSSIYAGWNGMKYLLFLDILHFLEVQMEHSLKFFNVK